MRRNIQRTICFATLMLAVAAVAAAQDDRICSNAGVAGEWGYTKTGTLYLPTGPIPFATLGKFTLGADGSFTGVNNGSVGGNVSKDILQGTFTIDPDCTGTMTVAVYSESRTLLRTITMALVVDDDEKELRGLVTSLVLPSGVSLPTVITAQAKKMFRNRANNAAPERGADKR